MTLEYEVAPAGGYYKATFRVGHGCGSSPTRQFVVEIPPGVMGAHPMPKPGWAIEIRTDKLVPPVSDHGRTVAEDVSRITWTARTRDDYLSNAHYDEFVLQSRVPSKEGPVYWKVSQVCEQGRADWTEIPAAGQNAGELKSPAPVLQIIPASGAVHQH